MRALFTAAVAATALTLALATPVFAAKRDVANIFFSPSGEPFRGGDKAAYAVALWFAEADANKDGALTREEFRADAMRFFASLDLNKDGKLDSAEIKHYEERIAPEMLARTFDTADVHGDKKETDIQPHNDSRLGNVTGTVDFGQNRQGAGFFSFLDEPEPVSAADIDFNNKVTREEFLAATNRRWSRLDPEGKGSIKFTDLPKTPIQVMRERLL